MLIQVLELAFRVDPSAFSDHPPGRSCFTYTNAILGAMEQGATWTVGIHKARLELKLWFWREKTLFKVNKIEDYFKNILLEEKHSNHFFFFVVRGYGERQASLFQAINLECNWKRPQENHLAVETGQVDQDKTLFLFEPCFRCYEENQADKTQLRWWAN